MTPLKRAKARVERAAMRWYRAYNKRLDASMLFDVYQAKMEEAELALCRALAALDKLTKSNRKEKA